MKINPLLSLFIVQNQSFKDYFRIMRITLFLLFACVFQLLAMDTEAQNSIITFSSNSISVGQLIEEIEKQTDYLVVYSNREIDINHQVTIRDKSAKVSSYLKEALAGMGISYKFENDYIILSKSNSLLNQLQQQEKITGTVTDVKGEPVIGANVSVVGRSIGTITDIDGKFVIQASQGNSLQISFIGYKTQITKVTGKHIAIVLQEDMEMLDEVVVVGYGVQKRKDLTGAIGSLKMNDLAGKQALSIADYLMGNIAGLNIGRSSSTNGQTKMSIRGENSISASTEPLLVVDGVIFPGGINDINSEDIETIDVLKDASSAAVYGARSAAGVVLVTTKKGKSQKPLVSVNTKWGIQTLIRKEQAYDVSGYLRMRTDAMEQYAPKDNMPGYYHNPNSLPSGVTLEQWLSYDGNVSDVNDPTDYWLNRLNLYPVEVANYRAGKSINWYDEVFRTGVLQDYNISLSGSSDVFTYYWSVGYLDNKGVVYNDDYKNIRSRLNIEGKVTDFLRVGLNASLSNFDNGNQPADWKKAFTNSPLGDIYTEDGSTYTKYPNGDNMAPNPFDPCSYSKNNKGTSLFAVAFAKVTLPLGFTYEMNYSNHWDWNNQYVYKPISSIGGGAAYGYGARNNSHSSKWSIDNILRWNKVFADKHRFDVTLLYNAEKYTYFKTEASSSSYDVSEILGFHALQLGRVYQAGSNDETDTAAAMMARLNYTYHDTYMLTLSFRRDGYSAFGVNNPWANFYSTAFAWRISEEEFMKNSRALSNLKLRFSYGINGNREVGRYRALSELKNDNYIVGSSPVVGLYTLNMANPNLKWEKTTSYNLGVDFGFFDNRLSGSLEMYTMQTKDLLLTRALPSTTGYASVISNMGQLNNKGLELTLNTLNIDKPNLRWTTSFNFSMNRNKIIHLYGDMVEIFDANGNVIGRREADDTKNGYYIGHALDAIYDYEVIGVWQQNEEEEAKKYGKFPGDFKVLDKNDDKQFSPDEDKTWQGHTEPRYRFGMRNQVTLFKSLDFSCMFRANLGHIKDATSYAQSSVYTQRVSDYVVPYWTPENPSNSYSRVWPTSIGAKVYRNASFFRIDDITIGYRLPEKIVKKIALQTARITFNIDNVCSFDSWGRWDPETEAPTPTVFTLNSYQFDGLI